MDIKYESSGLLLQEERARTARDFSISGCIFLARSQAWCMPKDRCCDSLQAETVNLHSAASAVCPRDHCELEAHTGALQKLAEASRSFCSLEPCVVKASVLACRTTGLYMY